MTKHLCKTIKKTGELRQMISQIDFEKIYNDDDHKKAAAKIKFFEKSGQLSALQHDLLELMKEV